MVVWCGRDEGTVQVCVVGGQMGGCCSAAGKERRRRNHFWLLFRVLVGFLLFFKEDVVFSCADFVFCGWVLCCNFADIRHIWSASGIGHVTLPKSSSLPC